MKTSERILATSLIMFNEEGEQNVTTVDIANEMDISPGNLYYHFRGKESIIDELYSRFDAEFSQLLKQSLDDLKTVEDHWYFLYVIFEEIYKFRFFYMNSTELMLKYPDLEKRFRRLLVFKISCMERFCERLIHDNNDSSETVNYSLLSENIVMNLIYWFPYQQLLSQGLTSGDQIHKGVYHILSLLGPYLGKSHKMFLDEVQLMYRQHLAKG